MNNEMTPERLRTEGVSAPGLPEVPPTRGGHVLYGIVVNDAAKEFVIACGDPKVYDTYRRKTKHPGDKGNWFFRTMELFFVPAKPAPAGRA